jgi:hypothetical protein
MSGLHCASLRHGCPLGGFGLPTPVLLSIYLHRHQSEGVDIQSILPPFSHMKKDRNDFLISCRNRQLRYGSVPSISIDFSPGLADINELRHGQFTICMRRRRTSKRMALWNAEPWTWQATPSSAACRPILWADDHGSSM